MTQATGVAELRASYREVVGDGQPPEAWLTLATSELTNASEALGMRHFADGDQRRELAAYARLLLGKATGVLLNALSALEREEHIDGPITEAIGGARAAQIMDELRAQARAEAAGSS